MLIDASLRELDNMRNGVSMLLNGGEMDGIHVFPEVGDAAVAHALSTEACHILSTGATRYDKRDPRALYANCTRHAGGVFMESFFSAVIRYADTVYYTLNTIPVTNATGRAALEHSDFWTWYGELHRQEAPFYRAICHSLAHRMLSLIKTSTSNGLLGMVAIASSFVSTYIAFLFVCYIPMIRGVGQHLADTQRMLLMFDDETLSSSGSLKTAVAGIVSSWDHDTAATDDDSESGAVNGLKLLFTGMCSRRLRCCGSRNSNCPCGGSRGSSLQFADSEMASGRALSYVSHTARQTAQKKAE